MLVYNKKGVQAIDKRSSKQEYHLKYEDLRVSSRYVVYEKIYMTFLYQLKSLNHAITIIHTHTFSKSKHSILAIRQVLDLM